MPTKYALPRWVHMSLMGEELVLLDTRRNEYWQINETGTLLLTALLDGSSEQNAAATLSSQYDIVLPKAESALKQLVTDLVNADLLRTGSR
ncbi:PqqD family peptide modification chaperone [Gordonia sputi]